MTQSSSPFQYLIDQQSQMLDSWSEMSKKMNENLFNGPNGNGHSETNGKAKEEANPTAFFENWFKQQQAMTQSIFGLYTKKPTNNNFLFTPEQLKSQFDIMQNWFNYYREALKNAGIDTPMMSMSDQVLQMGHQLDQFTKIYTQMAHFWEPLTKLIEQGISTEKVMQEWMNPEAYKNMFDTMMGAMNVETVFDKGKQLQEQYTQFMEKLQNGSPSQLSEAIGMKPWFNMIQQFNDQASQNLAPFSQSLTRSRESEILKLMQEIGIGFSDYSVKLAELQTSYYKTSYEALIQTVNESVEAYKENEETLNYETFFKKYLDQLENSLTTAFQTDEYGQLQGEVAKAGATMKNKMDKVTELMFAGTPFTMRSQTEDLAAELQNLKRKVRSLEKQLAETKVPAKAAAPRRTTAAAKK